MPSASIPSVIASSVRADRRSASAHRTREPTVASTRAISARMRSWRSPYRSPVLFAAQRTRGASFCAAPSRPHWSLLITAWVSSRTWLASGTVALDGARAVPLRRVISRLPATLHDGIREQIDRPSTLVTDRLTCPRLCRISRNPQLAGGSYLPVRKTLQGEIHPRVGPSMERDPPVRRDHPEEDRRAEVPLRRLPPTGLRLNTARWGPSSSRTGVARSPCCRVACRPWTGMRPLKSSGSPKPRSSLCGN